MALFENLTARLSRTVDTLRGRGRITEENVGAEFIIELPAG
jgi:signal recognition particle GTPase